MNKEQIDERIAERRAELNQLDLRKMILKAEIRAYEDVATHLKDDVCIVDVTKAPTLSSITDGSSSKR